MRGGHGVSFDWTLLRDLKTNAPLILAGGLTPNNIKDAQATGLDFFDLSSGVERRAGVKDPLKIKALMDALR